MSLKLGRLPLWERSGRGRSGGPSVKDFVEEAADALSDRGCRGGVEVVELLRVGRRVEDGPGATGISSAIEDKKGRMAAGQVRCGIEELFL